MKTIKLGEFELKTEVAIVSDPCYVIGTWCQITLNNVKKGLWSAYVLLTDKRVAQLLAFAGNALNNVQWQAVPGEVGVDSGQAGIFDARHYREDAIVKDVTRIGPSIICPDEPWYSVCCDRTNNTEHCAGVIPEGCVASSGYGDGSYDCFVGKDEKGRITAIKIDFISEDESNG